MSRILLQAIWFFKRSGERQQERHHTQIHYGSTQPTQFLPTLSSRKPFRGRNGKMRTVLKRTQLGNEIESSSHNRQRVESHSYSDQLAPARIFQFSASETTRDRIRKG